MGSPLIIDLIRLCFRLVSVFLNRNSEHIPRRLSKRSADNAVGAAGSFNISDLIIVALRLTKEKVRPKYG